VDVRWSVDNGRGHLEIIDDGKGQDRFSVDAGARTLETIRARANSIGAQLRIEGSAGGGVRLTVDVATGPEAPTR
jgi:signal transduction histidine kinase